MVFSFLLFHEITFSKNIGRVEKVSGHVFAVLEGKTWELKKGDLIPDFSVIITEEHGTLTYTDFHDHQFHPLFDQNPP